MYRRRRYSTLIFATSALVMLAACFSSRASTFATDRGPCNTRSDLTGQWRSRRGSQLGPATMVLTLHCDCRYSMRTNLWFGRVAEAGEYRIRSSTESSWRFELVDEKLRLYEAPDEAYEYSKDRALQCP